MIHDSNKAHTGSLTGLTVELSIPGSCLEFGPFSADCSPKAPQNTRREGDTSLCAHQIHAVASKTAGKPRQTSRSCEAAWRNTFSPAARQKNTPLWFSLRVKRTQSREWEITRKKTERKESQLWCGRAAPSMLISNPALLWGSRTWRRRGKRSSETCPFLLRNFGAVRLAAAVGATCAVQDPHSAAWAHSRGMRGEGPQGCLGHGVHAAASDSCMFVLVRTNLVEMYSFIAKWDVFWNDF